MCRTIPTLEMLESAVATATYDRVACARRRGDRWRRLFSGKDCSADHTFTFTHLALAGLLICAGVYGSLRAAAEGSGGLVGVWLAVLIIGLVLLGVFGVILASAVLRQLR